MNNENLLATAPVEDAPELSPREDSLPLVDLKVCCRHATASDAEVHYSRLFNERFDEHSPTALIELANKMMGDGGLHDIRRTPSGVVYLGQFIAHDITRDGTSLTAHPFPPPGIQINGRTPLLDLDSVYGNGPVGAAVYPGEDQMYFRPSPGREIFKLGATEPEVVDDFPFVSSNVDFPRRSDKSPVIPDDRNDDNIIISQLHVLFLRFHNRLLDLIVAPGSTIPVPVGTTPFEQTRRLVKWHYQRLVREYFLPRIVMKSVLESVVNDIEANRPKLFKPQTAKDLSLPVEFTMAAFRFGHSMVQEGYHINKKVTLMTSQILNKEYRPLSAAHVLEWKRFVESGLKNRINHAQRINTTISKGLFDLSNPMVIRYKDNSMPATVGILPARTLLRGSKARLPSGQEACERSETQFIKVDATHRHFAVLEDNGLLKRLPLWYYLLHEAEVAGVDESLPEGSQVGGARLGPLGSRIVAEVLLGLLKVDEDSYLSKGWTPPALPFPKGLPRPITNLGDLVDFVS